MEKLSLVLSSLGAFGTNFTAFSKITTIVVVALFALNIVFVVYYFRKRALLQRVGGLGFIGAFTGLLGVGCAACGSVILSSLFGVAATAGFIGILPFGGQEFSIASILILGFSIFLTAKKIREPATCEIIPAP